MSARYGRGRKRSPGTEQVERQRAVCPSQEKRGRFSQRRGSIGYSISVGHSGKIKIYLNLKNQIRGGTVQHTALWHYKNNYDYADDNGGGGDDDDDERSSRCQFS